MSTNKKFRIQNGVDVSNGDISINDVTVIGADGKVVPAAIADAVAGLTSSDIADLQAQVSAILGTSPETLDTLQEIVAAFESADNSLTASVAANTTAHQANSAAISAEETARIAGDATVQAAVDATNARTAGISTSSGSSNIEMAADVDMGTNNITNAGDVYAARGFIDTIEAESLTVQTGTVDFSGSTVNFGSSQITGGGFGQATKQEIDQHLNQPAAGTNEFLKWNGSDYEFTDYIQGQLATNMITVEGTLRTEQPGSTIDWQDGLVHFGGSQVIVDEPSSSTHAANKSYVDAGDSDLSAAISAEVTRATAAETDLANDINVETARAVAVEGSLQSQIDSVSSGGVTGRQALQDAIDAEEAARIAADAVLQSNIDAEASARAGADNTLQSNIDTVSAAVSAITNGSPETLNQLTELVAAYEGADSDLQTLISNLGGDASALTARVSTLESEMDATETATSSNASAISAEVTRATAAEGVNAAAISAEASARAAAVQAEQTARQNAVTAETNARILADNGLQAQIDALDNSTTGDKSDLQAQITSNDNDIAALQTRAGTIEADYATVAQLNVESATRAAADTQLESDLDTEVARATAAEGAIASDLAQEIIDRQNADTGLQTQIDFIKQNTDPAALDSLTEIVAAFQAADGSITGVVNSNTGRISALESGVVAIEAWDTDNVSEGSTNLYFTEARAKACVGADAGSCLDYNQTSGKFSLDLTETAGALVPDNSSNADKLDGQHGSHYRIDVYDVNGTVVN